MGGAVLPPLLFTLHFNVIDFLSLQLKEKIHLNFQISDK